MEGEKRERRQAVALRYEPGRDEAPVILGAASGSFAEKLVESARERNIPVHEDGGLAKTLGLLSPGSRIPEELYEVVARILVFVCQADSEYAASLK